MKEDIYYAGDSIQVTSSEVRSRTGVYPLLSVQSLRVLSKPSRQIPGWALWIYRVSRQLAWIAFLATIAIVTLMRSSEEKDRLVVVFLLILALAYGVRFAFNLQNVYVLEVTTTLGRSEIVE